MRYVVIVIASLLTVALVNPTTPAGDAKDAPATQPATQPTTQPATTDAPTNTHCPVMKDHAADPEVVYVHDGKTIAFCCDHCLEKFKKNPGKYAK